MVYIGCSDRCVAVIDCTLQRYIGIPDPPPLFWFVHARYAHFTFTVRVPLHVTTTGSVTPVSHPILLPLIDVVGWLFYVYVPPVVHTPAFVYAVRYWDV